MGEGAADEVQDVFVGEAVEDVFPGAAAGDELLGAEEAELLSHPRAVRRAEKTLLGQPLTPDDWDDAPRPRPPDGP